MIKMTVVVREAGKLKPDYSLDFNLPAVPHVGDYISIQRPDHPAPFGEDMIVRQVWWRLDHPETGGFTTAGQEKLGKLGEIMVECEPALSPWSSDNWRKSLSYAESNGKVPSFDVARMSFPENLIKGQE
jgi:hypothetical protein